MTEFETKLQAAIRQAIKTWKREGTVSMGFDCFTQNCSHLPYSHGFYSCVGAPCGTNGQWMFRESLKRIITGDKVIARFVR